MIAHELTHVVQNRAVPAPVLRRQPTRPPTYGNLAPRDTQDSARIVRLEQAEGLWYEIGPRGDRHRARELYDFVVKDGKVLALQHRRPRSNTPPGHLTLAKGGRVEYAGQVRFGRSKTTRGTVKQWSNASGHFAPTGGGTNAAEERFLDRVPFARDKFKREVPDNVPRKGPQRPRKGPLLPVFQPETKPRTGGTGTQVTAKAERDASSTTGNAARAEQTAAKTERATVKATDLAAKADQSATTATKTAAKAETSTARRVFTSAFELAKIGALDAADFYLQLHEAHFAALEAVSQHVGVAKDLLANVANFETGARALRQRVDRAWRDEAALPGDPLDRGEEAPPQVTMDDIDYVTAYRDAAARIANDAFHARQELDRIVQGWDAATAQATGTADFTRQAVNDMVAALDLDFAREPGGAFRPYLVNVRNRAARIESFASYKFDAAKEILETVDIQKLSYQRAQSIAARERKEADTRADRPQDVLRFAQSGTKVTMANLLAWARRNYPDLATNPKTLQICLNNIYASNKFTGSESAREGAAIDLVLHLRGKNP